MPKELSWFAVVQPLVGEGGHPRTTWSAAREVRDERKPGSWARGSADGEAV